MYMYKIFGLQMALRENLMIIAVIMIWKVITLIIMIIMIMIIIIIIGTTDILHIFFFFSLPQCTALIACPVRQHIL